jgi:hypothetical protein
MIFNGSRTDFIVGYKKFSCFAENGHIDVPTQNAKKVVEIDVVCDKNNIFVMKWGYHDMRFQ